MLPAISLVNAGAHVPRPVPIFGGYPRRPISLLWSLRHRLPRRVQLSIMANRPGVPGDADGHVVGSADGTAVSGRPRS